MGSQQAGSERNSSKFPFGDSQKGAFWCPTAANGSLHFWSDTMVDFSLRTQALFFRLLLYSSLETLSHAVGNPTHQVKGILGGSVLFSANVAQGITVEKIEWDFYPQRGGLGFWLGEFRHGKLEHPSPTDRFGQRLDMVDETTLRIKDLELDDGGIYNTRIWFTKAQFQEQSFSLTVYEPVPTPQIDHHVESKTPGGCNVTLRCHTPGREELKVSWETGNPHRASGKSVNQYQVSDNGRELHVFYWNSSFYSKFTCLVSNPVDQKRAYFYLLSICQSDEGANLSLYEIAIICVSVVAILFLIGVGLFWKRKTLKSKFRKVFCHRNSTPNATELQEVKTLPSASLQNGYSKCPRSEPDNISDSIHPPRPLENC